MLSKHPDLCKFPHGHTRKVEFVIEAEALNQNDMVCDFKVLSETTCAYLKNFDHALCVNTEDPHFDQLEAAFGDRIVPFEGKDPTTEVLARTIFEEAKKRLAEYAARPEANYPVGHAVRLVSVRIWETSSSWAEYGE
jgi:6-pyruvoyltetrahydropterin/6-carboxytetrahydropterin synthase